MEVKNNKTLLYVILGVVVVFLIGITVFVLLNKKPAPVDNNTPEVKEPEVKEPEKVSITEDQKKLYSTLKTDSGEYGFYLNKNVSIDDITPEEMLEYALENYIKDKNIPMMGEYSLCLEDIEMNGKFGNECKKNISKFTIKKADLDNYIKTKFNTTRVFTLTKGKTNYAFGIVNGHSTGGYMYDFSKNVYYVGLISKSGSSAEIFTDLLKVETDDNNIYFYDKMLYCFYDMGAIFCFNAFESEYNEEKAIFYAYDEDMNIENNKYKEIKYITETDEDGEEYSYPVIDYDYIFKNKKDSLNTYKHTFKKSSDGNYYWYSSELVKE